MDMGRKRMREAFRFARCSSRAICHHRHGDICSLVVDPHDRYTETCRRRYESSGMVEGGSMYESPEVLATFEADELMLEVVGSGSCHLDG